MREYYGRFKAFVHKHKTKIIVIGGVVVTSVVVAKNWDSLVEHFAPNLLSNALDVKNLSGIPAVDTITNIINDESVKNNIRQFPLSIRNLPDGWSASAEKLALAKEMNIDLLEQQTWVRSFTKNCA